MAQFQGWFADKVSNALMNSGGATAVPTDGFRCVYKALREPNLVTVTRSRHYYKQQ